ncbi:hypothetical protein O0L34_g6152 [Tuta absoluta]|nr:hypothetical protein O0L34_g6152 [Tuta absoluta]
MFLIVVLVLLVTNTVNSELCSKIESVNITDGALFENGSVLFEDVEYTSSQWYEVSEEGQDVRYGCPCIGRICLWKCCGDGEMLVKKDCAASNASEVNPFKPPVYKGRDLTEVDATQHFFYLHNVKQCATKFIVDTDFGDEVMVQENATLYQIISGQAQWHPPQTYCVDMRTTNVTVGSRLVALVCHPETIDDPPSLYIGYAIGLLLSVPFLLATFIVYAFIPELRNLHGMCLMAYCAGLIVAYPLLAYLKLQIGDINVSPSGCLGIAFVVYYSFQTSFFWLNVMCFDIWRTFSGYHRGTSSKRRDQKRFLLYGLYAWGVPLLLTAVTAFMQFNDSLPEGIIRPGFGNQRCWFEDWHSDLVYFFAPVLILVVCNVVLFVITAHRIRSIRQETAILKSSESSRSDKINRDKERYALYLKLFVVMGVNWSVEVISFAAGGTNWYWVVVDLSNIALGIFIFFIFVWKNKVRNLIRKKISKLRGIPAEGTSTNYSESGTGRWATRSSTAATEVTRVNSSDEAGVRLKDLR